MNAPIDKFTEEADAIMRYLNRLSERLRVVTITMVDLQVDVELARLGMKAFLAASAQLERQE